MQKIKLTDAKVNTIKPPREGQLEIFDAAKDSPSAFGLRVSYGGKKTWIVLGRLHKTLIRYKLGEYPVVSLKQARKLAREFKEKIAKGEDPRKEAELKRTREAAERRKTFSAMADEFIRDHCEAQPLRKRSIDSYKSTLKGEVTREWHDQPISLVTRADVKDLIRGIEARGKKAMARLVKAHLGKFFGWCRDEDKIEASPADGVKVKAKPVKRDRSLSAPEFRRVWTAVAKLNDPERAFVRTLILTGQRRYETSVMRWDNLPDFDGPNASWDIPAAVTKNGKPHRVPLSPEAVGIINALPRLDNCPFVFSYGKKPLNSFSAIKRSIDTAVGKPALAHWTIHDLRRTFVTMANEKGLAQPHVIEAAVNHASGHKGGIAGNYNLAEYADEKRKLMAAWAKHVVDGDPGGNVVHMEERRRG